MQRDVITTLSGYLCKVPDIFVQFLTHHEFYRYYCIYHT